METLHLITILIEVAIAVLALLAILKGRAYMCGFLIAYAMYVIYDLAKHYSWQIGSDFLTLWFFVATVAALYSAYMIYRNKK